MNRGPKGMIGFPDETNEFRRRHKAFCEGMPRLEILLKRVFEREFVDDGVTGTIYYLSRICAEDFMEILLLVGHGYGHAARKLLRGLYEKAVTARFLIEHPERTDEFLEFGLINMYKLAKEGEPHGFKVPEPLRTEAFKTYERYKKEKRDTTRWCTDRTFRDIATKSGFLAGLYPVAFLIPTFLLHPSSQAIMWRLEKTEDGTTFESGPQRDAGDDALVWAHMIILDVIRQQRHYFNLPGLDELIKACEKDWEAAWLPKSPGTDPPPPPTAP